MRVLFRRLLLLFVFDIRYWCVTALKVKLRSRTCRGVPF
jgi:hypothetical protein